MDYQIGFFGARRGVGSTLIAAHLLCYLKEHGLQSLASTLRPGSRPHQHDLSRHRRELEERWGFAEKLGGLSLRDLLQAPLPVPGLGVVIQDIRTDVPKLALPRMLGDLWVVTIRDEVSFAYAVGLLPSLRGAKLLVWNRATPEVQARCRLPDSAQKFAQIAATSIPPCGALDCAHTTAKPVWRLPDGAASPGGRAMTRLMREILRHTTLEPGLLEKARVPHAVMAEGATG